MKTAILLFASILVVAYAQPNMVSHEVHAIIAADTSITVDECTKQCDDVFNMVDPMDETMNDNQCAHQCDCQIKNTCGRPPLRTTTSAA